MAAANAVGDKLPMFNIGKANNPRCFKNVKFLPCRYRNQQKSSMDGKLFEEWSIVNCFRKSEIFTESQETAIVEDEDPFPELQDEMDDQRSVQRNLIKEDFDATAFADGDAKIIAVQPSPSGAKIVAELLETEAVCDYYYYYYSSKVPDKPVKCPDKNELLEVIETLQIFSLSLDKGGEEGGAQSSLTPVALKVKSINTLLKRRSKHPLGTF